MPLCYANNPDTLKERKNERQNHKNRIIKLNEVKNLNKEKKRIEKTETYRNTKQEQRRE